MKTKLSPLIAAALVVTSAPGTTFSDERSVVDEVVVSATRRESTSTEISAAVGTVDEEHLRSAKLVTDALANAAGVSVQQTTPGQGAAIVRGLRGSSILHLVDQVRLNNALFRSAPTQYFALLPATAIERVEVLRGTPSSLYGSDAVGGIVHAVTRVPNFDASATETSGELLAAYDSADLGKTLRGRLDIGNKEVASTLSLEHLRTGNRRIGGGERVAPSGYESMGGRFAMSITPDDSRSWFFDVHTMKQPDTPRIDELVAGFGQAQPSSSEFSFAPNRRLFAHARYMHQDGAFDIDWQFDLSWQRIDDDRISRSFESTVRRYEQNRSDLVAALMTVSGAMNRGTWVSGIEVTRDRVNSRRVEEQIDSGQRQDVAARFPDGSSVDRAAIFFNAEHPVADRQNLSAGLRFSSVTVELPESAELAAAKVDVSDVSGDIGWRFDLNNEWQLVANVGYGFRAPNVFDLGTLGERPGNRFNIPNTALDSERVLHSDLGLRRATDRLRLEFMLYSLDYKDRISSVATGDVTADGRDIVQSVNATDSSIYGAELTATLRVFEGITFDARLNFARGEQTIAGDAEAADRIPPFGGQIGVQIDYGGSLRFSSWLRFADAQDRLSARDVEDVRIDPDGTPGWLIIGAAAEWQSSQELTIQFGIDNLLDKRYRRHGSGIDAPGRNLTVSATYAW